MADFVSSLNGNQMDAALMDMAEHNSEAWAVGERNGVAVETDDVAYHNNARYYAQQAQSIAPASVTEAVRWDIAQTALTDANKEQARANIDAGKNGAWSNRNLLDNWYFVGGGSQLGDGIFPINQRGQTSYTGGRSIDRWRCWQSSTVTLTAAGLTFATGAKADGLFQYFPKGKFESLYGETVTASLLLKDGTLYTATGTASANCWIVKNFSGGYFGYICNGTEANFRINLNANQSKSIKACKLEKGTYSTLLNDVPPDFGAELAKCQWYLRNVPLKRTPVFLDDPYSVAVVTLIGIEMASSPTISLITAGKAWSPSTNTSATTTAASVISFDYNMPTIQLSLSSALSGIGVISDAVVRLSCEL